jgi:hypothetical protein
MELCNCGAPLGETEYGKGSCGNCGFLLTDKAELDIVDIPEQLYFDVLSEFIRQYGDCFRFVDWKITARITDATTIPEEGNDDNS